MNKYVVAFSAESGDAISQTLVWAESERSAVLKYLAQFQDIVFEEHELLSMESLDELLDYCYDYYAAAVSVIEV